MGLPPIDPTGAMSSGDYVTYMIAYNDTALDYLEGEVIKYVGEYTAASWNSEWGRSIDGLSSKITTLNADIVKVQAQLNMVENAVNGL